jgi:hypothetical protein
MRRNIITAVSAAALVIAGAVPAAAAMGQGPGHGLPNVEGVNVLAHADTSDYSLAFTAHTRKTGDAHGSIDFETDGVTLTKLDLQRLALVTAEAAAANGCKHGEMWIARGTALYNGTEQVRVWIDLQDRDGAGDLVRIRAMALKDHDGHDDGTDDHATDPGHTGGTPGGSPGGGHDEGTDGHDEGTDGHDEGTDSHDDGHDDGHTGCGGGGSPWLYRSHWFDVRDVNVNYKGYEKK